MSYEFFWRRRIDHLNTLLHRTKQEELTDAERVELEGEWEKTIVESKVNDPTQLGTLLNELVRVTKIKLESFGKRWYGKSYVWR